MKCVNCRGRVSEDAELCVHCGMRFDAELLKQMKNKATEQKVLSLLILCCSVFLVFTFASALSLLVSGAGIGIGAQIRSFSDYFNSFGTTLMTILGGVGFVLMSVLLAVSFIFVVIMLALSIKYISKDMPMNVRLMKIYSVIVLAIFCLIFVATIAYLTINFMFNFMIVIYITIFIFKPKFASDLTSKTEHAERKLSQLTVLLSVIIIVLFGNQLRGTNPWISIEWGYKTYNIIQIIFDGGYFANAGAEYLVMLKILPLVSAVLLVGVFTANVVLYSLGKRLPDYVTLPVLIISFLLQIGMGVGAYVSQNLTEGSQEFQMLFCYYIETILIFMTVVYIFVNQILFGAKRQKEVKA